MKYRECTKSDFDKIIPLLQQLWPDQKLNVMSLKKVFLIGIDSDCQCYVCAEDAGKIVGFCSLTMKNNLWQHGNLGYIDELIVDDSYRGNGVGKGLLKTMSATAKNMGCKRIELDSAYHRIEAHKFYEKNGFINRGILFSKVLNDI